MNEALGGLSRENAGEQGPDGKSATPIPKGRRRWQRLEWFLVGPSLFMFLAGCLNYDMTLQNGDILRSKTKPKLNERGYYVYKDVLGREREINSMRIRQIEAVRAGSPTKREF